jgi:hypothetical protein
MAKWKPQPQPILVCNACAHEWRPIMRGWAFHEKCPSCGTADNFEVKVTEPRK